MSREGGRTDAAKLLEAVLAERQHEWEENELARFAADVATPPQTWKSKYKRPADPVFPDRYAEVPDGWVVASLEQLTSGVRLICYGILMPKEHVPNGVLYVKVRDMRGDVIDVATLQKTSPLIAAQYVRASLRSGDWLLAIRGTYGRVAEVPPELDGGNITQDTARLAITDKINSRFVAWQLRAPDCQDYFKRVARGVAVKGVNIGDVRPCPIFLPSRSQQELIVGKLEELLSDLEAGVAALQRAKANLKRYRAAVLKAAVEGKLTAEWRANHPPKEPASKLLERILTERRKKWEQDQLATYEAKGKQPPTNWRDKYQEPHGPDTAALPALPEGWCWATVSQVSQFVRYGTSAKASLDSAGVPVLRMGNIRDGGLNVDDLKYLPIDHAEFPELLLRYGDMLFNRTNSTELVGKSAVYRGVPAACSYASYLIGVRLCSGCDSRLLACYLNSAFGRAWVKSVVSQQVGQANVNGTKLQALSFPLPPVAEQMEIIQQVEERVSVLEQACNQIEANLRRATRLRQSILKRAFEGKLVPQDPTDEPAMLLVGRTAREDTEASVQQSTRQTKHNRNRRKTGGR